MYIYKIINDITKEIYIGQTKLELESRLQRHISDAQASFECRRRDFSYFHRKLMFYGPENFHIELIENVEQGQADIREQYWIKFYDSYEHGYNSTLGGQNIIHEQQAQIRQKWKQSFKITQETTKISNFKLIGNQAAAKPVTCYDDLGIPIQTFPSITQAARFYHIGVQTLHRALRQGENTLSAGLRWRYTKDNIDKLTPLQHKPNVSKNAIPDTKKIILQFDKKGNFIQEWENAQKAADTLHINPRCILYVCNHKQKTSGGYVWEFQTNVID